MKTGQECNHALIQWYRSGNDNISEHSDKTLDIKQGSSVITVSQGSMRTLILRSKSTVDITVNNTTMMMSAEAVEGIVDNVPRDIQKIRLPHNSIFVLGWNTNRNYTHSIKPDKRMKTEKSSEEAAYDCQRISITFRTITTFYDSVNLHLVGQGAPKSSLATALTKEEAEAEYTQMIHAFSAENKQGTIWYIISPHLLPSLTTVLIIFCSLTSIFLSSRFFVFVYMGRQ